MFKILWEKIFDMLEGMWAFALLDLKKIELILSRDRFGEKPLYFKKTKGGILVQKQDLLKSYLDMTSKLIIKR